MRIVTDDKEFKFRKLCPYCGGHMIYRANGWDIDDGKYPRKLKKKLKRIGKWPLWIATQFDGDCITMPDFDSDEIDDWMDSHSIDTYSIQMPVDQKVERFIKKRYRYFL